MHGMNPTLQVCLPAGDLAGDLMRDFLYRCHIHFSTTTKLRQVVKKEMLKTAQKQKNPDFSGFFRDHNWSE